MHSMLQDRGYRHFTGLLALQTLAFGLFVATTLLARPVSSADPVSAWLPQALVAWLGVGLLSLFAARVWSILGDSIFCLGFIPWPVFVRQFLRPALYLAPLSLAAGAALQLAGVERLLALAPALALGIVAALACAWWLVRAWLLHREARRQIPEELKLIDRLRERHGDASVQRLADSFAYASGRVAYNPFQMQRGLTLIDLPAKPWFDRAEFAWASVFEASFGAIKAEALSVLSRAGRNSYPGAISGSWGVYPLVDDDPLPEAELRCPATLRALRQVPGFPVLRRAFFSVLEPGSRILPHCDHSNIWITAHLGIQVPKDCALRVGRQVRQWKESEFLFFDTSYQHEAWNDSTEPRIVLLFNFLNPLLSDAEREFFTER